VPEIIGCVLGEESPPYQRIARSEYLRDRCQVPSFTRPFFHHTSRAMRRSETKRVM